MPAGSELVVVGRITGTHGIRGAVKAHLFSGDDTTLRAIPEVLLKGADGREIPLRITGIQIHGRKSLLTIEGYGSINDVVSLVGGDILVRRDQLPEPDDDEYYWTDLIGLRVMTDAGRELGELREIMETGSNDVYVVRGNGTEYLIPATDEVVSAIDLEAGTMTVTPLDGLLDL